jgi:hypothetical protein
MSANSPSSANRSRNRSYASHALATPAVSGACGWTPSSNSASTLLSTRLTKHVLVAVQSPAHAVHEGGDHRVVARHAEQQGHVDVDTLGQQPRDRIKTRLGAGHLDHEVGAVELRGQRESLGDRGLGVVGLRRVELDRHLTMTPIGALPNVEELIARGSDVGLHDGPQRIFRIAAVELAQLLVVRVVGVATQRRFEDGGVGGQSFELTGPDEGVEVRARTEIGPFDAVEPDRLVQLSQLL